MTMPESDESHRPTSSLEELIRALEIAQSELNYQLMRLDTHVSPRNEEEAKYHANMKEGYRTAQYWLGILRRYHGGRLERLQSAERNENDDTETDS